MARRAGRRGGAVEAPQAFCVAEGAATAPISAGTCRAAVREVSARQRAPCGRKRIDVPIFRDSGYLPDGSPNPQ